MEDAGTLPASMPPRRWCLGAESPVANPVAELPPALLPPLHESAAGAPDVLPDDYGDAGGLWLTVRRQNPFDVLLLNGGSEVAPETILVRFRVLWKFWTQKLTVARQGATRTVVRRKYGDDIESYIDNLQWAYDQLSADGGSDFWRSRLAEERSKTLWSRMSDIVDATLADGLLDAAEVKHLISRAESVGYEREEFAVLLRDALHARRFEPETAPAGEAASTQLASVRWATSEVWARLRAAPKAASPMPVQQYYLRMRRTGAVFGPVPAENVPVVVRMHGLAASDDICVVGASVWQPIEQSQYGHCVRPESATYGYACPHCGQTLISWVEASPAGWVVFAIGVLTLLLYVGIIFLIIGIVMLATRTRTQHWRCAHCGYAS